MATKCYLKNPGVKRLMRESQELANPTEDYYACPLEDNLFEWHFTIKGPPESEFQDGYYHGRILLPPQYPMKPPNIILLTPNGRFEINKKICLSISGYHPETWQPSWSIRTVLLALIAFMPTKGVGTIGSLDYTREERRTLAKKSKDWECNICGKIANKLMEAEITESPTLTKEESSMLQNIAFKAEEEANRKDQSAEVQTSTEENSKKENNGQVPEPSSSNIDNLRQRNVPNGNSSATATVAEAQNDDAYIEGIRANIENRKWDRFWKIVVYIILFLIVIILIRRFFFINANY